MRKTLIKNGIIVNSEGSIKADILIGDETIIQIASEINSNNNIDIVIDADGKYVFPGGIDPHVHFHLPTPAGYSCDDFESGSRAAIAGGTTTIIDFVTPAKNESLLNALEKRKTEAQRCLCDYSFHISPTCWSDTVANEMESCVKKEGITSFKTYMAYKNSIGVEDDVLDKIMQQAAKLNAVVAIHAEDGDTIDKLRDQFIKDGNVTPKYHALSQPASVETEAVKRAISLAEKNRTKVYFVHVSAAESVNLIYYAQKRGLEIYGETCPQYLMFDDSKLIDDFYSSAPFVFSPALHKASHKDKLWEAISNNQLQTVGTDHCPFNLYGQKDIGINNFTKIPNGAGGVEHRLELLFTYGVLKNRITIEKMVELVSTKPAKIFNLSKKGIIKENFDADLVIWNPNVERTISVKTQFQNSDSNIYEGITVKGRAEQVFLRGNLIYSKGKHHDNKGKIIYRK